MFSQGLKSLTIARIVSTLILVCVSQFSLIGQEDTTAVEEEDWSMYDNLEFVDEGVKRFASAKIKGISPAQFISVGYDFQSAHSLTAGAGPFIRTDAMEESTQINAAHGLRVNANIPVVSRNDVIIQFGGQYWETNYEMNPAVPPQHPLIQSLSQNGLKSLALNTTIFKPLSEYSFLLVQAEASMNGDYSLSEFQHMRYNRYAAAAIWGRRPNDYTQWGIGVSRTYRAGELNYIPVLLYNKTSVKGKWGTEILFPARGHVRYSVNTRNLLFGGFELEGNSYRIGNQNLAMAQPFDELELRRSELRFRMMYQRQLVGFIWISAQAGYRVMYSFNVDSVPDGEDFFRGFFGDQPFAFVNTVGNPFYANISINFVSP